MQFGPYNRSNRGPIATMEHCLGVVPFDRARADTLAKPNFPNSASRKFPAGSELAITS